MTKPDAVQLSLDVDRPRSSDADPLWLAAVDQARKGSALADEELKRHSDSARAWKRLREAFADDQPDAVARILSDSRSRASLEVMQDLKPTLERLRVASTARIQSRTTQLTGAAMAFAQERGWPASKASDGVRIGHLIKIVPDPAGTTKVGSQRVRSLNWDSVKPVLDSEYARLWQKSEKDTEDFATELVDVLGELKGESGEGGYVRLKSVYNGIAARRPKRHGAIPDYYRDEFSADLSLLLRRQQRASSEKRYELASIRNPELAFEVVQPDGNLTHFGFIRAVRR